MEMELRFSLKLTAISCKDLQEMRNVPGESGIMFSTAKRVVGFDSLLGRAFLLEVVCCPSSMSRSMFSQCVSRQ